jgi:3',5'-cyclic AMP phosphodiesterase CpdA
LFFFFFVLFSFFFFFLFSFFFLQLLDKWKMLKKLRELAPDPTTAYAVASVHLTFKETDITHVARRNRDEKMLRVVCVSDTHSRHARMAHRIPSGDVLIHAGDLTNVGRGKEVLEVCAWLKEQQARFKHVVVVCGNHDIGLQEQEYSKLAQRFHGAEREDPVALRAALKECCTLLEDSPVTIDGVNFYGSPWQPWFHDWAYVGWTGDCGRFFFFFMFVCVCSTTVPLNFFLNFTAGTWSAARSAARCGQRSQQRPKS